MPHNHPHLWADTVASAEGPTAHSFLYPTGPSGPGPRGAHLKGGFERSHPCSEDKTAQHLLRFQPQPKAQRPLMAEGCLRGREQTHLLFAPHLHRTLTVFHESELSPHWLSQPPLTRQCTVRGPVSTVPRSTLTPPREGATLIA